MSDVQNELLKTAGDDLKAVKCLTEAGYFPQAIYLSEQVVEKASKSVFAYHLINFKNEKPMTVGDKIKRAYGHDLLKSTKELYNILLQLYIDNEIKQKPHLTTASISQARLELHNVIMQVERDVLVKDKIIIDFPGLISRFYQNVFLRVNNNSLIDPNPQITLLKESLKDPSNQYLKYLSLVHMLAVFLDGMDIRARYPLSEFDYNNISLLKEKQNKKAMDQLIEMLDELVSLVPVVWKQLDMFKTNL